MRDLTKAYELIKTWEGCKLTAYPDPVSGGVPWTIGYGTTENVHPGMTISQEQAEKLMQADVQRRASQICSWIAIPVDDAQVCAMVSLAYNIGMTAFYHSQLLADVNLQKPAAVCAEDFLHWTHAGGHVVQGLVNRRNAEAAVFLS